jgi:alpha-ketoglutarate-dependent taurine dioxygenase
MMNQLFSYQKLSDQSFGILLNEDLNKLDKKQIKQVGNIFLKELLVICSNQFFSPRKFASICYTWGKPQIFDPSRFYSLDNKNKKKIEKLGLGNIPGLVKVSAYKDDENDLLGILSDSELEWHSDGSGKPHPPEVIALYAVEVGPNNHTDFLECVSPYEKLTLEDKKFVDSLEYIHMYDTSSVPKYALKHKTQLQILYSSEISEKKIKLPLIVKSPGGYRGFRYNCRSFVKFAYKTDKESKEIQKWIESLLFKEENVYTHHWKQGDLIFMDQTVMLHRRRLQDFSNRLLYRMQFDVSKIKV